tara:strand:+ start:370 stop:594 length:225 start_codon:yes stop_codon:yes gene_type:complete
MTDRTLPTGIKIMDAEPLKVTNPFSGDSVMLEPDALAVYDFIKGSEVLGHYEDLREGINWFAEHEPEAYMILLD